MRIKVDQGTIRALQKILTGDPVTNNDSLAPYRSGPDLIKFFKQFGFEEEYGDGFPARWNYAEDKLYELNGEPEFKTVIEACVDPRHFLHSEFSLDEAVHYLNQFLELDGYKLLKHGNIYKLSTISQNTVTFEHAILDNNTPNINFIQEQIDKCHNKVSNKDYDGAITNARSLLEAVLIEIEEGITGSSSEDYKGNLKQLYQRVHKLLNLDPSRQDISDNLKPILTGIISIVNGIASIRNKFSDSHARRYQPAEHHAKLAINSVYTICMFFLDSFEYQVKSGFIKLPDNKSNAAETYGSEH